MLDRTQNDPESSQRSVLDTLLVPSGGLQGPLFASLLRRLTKPAPAPELAGGELIGPYRVLSALGRGGMATVYLAERADGEFEQRVALKLVTPGRDAPEARELLRRERQILASLQHPNIARLLDGGTTDDGLLWFAMEPISGERIDQYCDARALPVRARLALFLQVCAALKFAHARLLVHRDIKPSNILVTADGEVKLLDFGIATVLQSEPAATSTATTFFTPAFASPEQRRGEPATTASDIWQLGRLAEALIEGDRAMPKHAKADLDAIIAKAKQADPAQRYDSVGELALDVSRHLEQRPVLARKASPWYRARLFFARHALSTAIAGLALGSSVAMAAHFTWELKHERDTAAREAERANAATSFLINQFGDADPNVNRGSSVTAEQILARATTRLHSDLGDKPALRARLLQAIAKIHMSLGEPKRAQPLVDEAVVELRRLPSERFALAEALQVQGVVALQLGHPQEALDRFDESAALNDGATPAADSLRLQTLDVRSMAQIGAGQFAAALATQQGAVEMARRLYGSQSQEIAASLNNLAITLRANGKRDETAQVFGQTWELYRLLLGADHPQAVGAQKSYALALIDQGKLAEARPLLEQAVERNRKLYHGRGQHYAAAVRGLAQLHVALGDLPTAIVHLQQSEALYIDALGPESLALTYTLHALGDAHAQLGDHASALTYFQRSLEIRKKLMPPGQPMIVGSTSVVARELLALGRRAEAQKSAEEAVARAREYLKPDDPHLEEALLLVEKARLAQAK